MKFEVPNKKLSNSWSMTGLKTFVQLSGRDKLWFNHLRKIAKTAQMPNYPNPFLKSSKYSGVHLSKCDYCSRSKLFT